MEMVDPATATFRHRSIEAVLLSGGHAGMLNNTLLSNFLEEQSGWKLGSAQRMREQWTRRTLDEQRGALQALLLRSSDTATASLDHPERKFFPFSISYDGQTRLAECVIVMFRVVEEDKWCITLRAAELKIFSKHCTAAMQSEELQLTVATFANNFSVAAFQRDGATVNQAVCMAMDRSEPDGCASTF